MSGRPITNANGLAREFDGSRRLYPAPARSESLRVLTIRDDAERARAIGELHRGGILQATAELLIDAEEDSATRPLQA